MPTLPPPGYRSDIDGLRAIAILGVLFFHAGFGFPGGYVGVDVFFVISGFLITRLILKDLRRGSFSLLDFWERRARRILPALAVVVLAILVVGWFVLVPSDYASLGKQVIALIAFSSNIKFWREAGYFEEAAESKPLLHTWSLSLEEQFYLFIPLLLLGLYRFRKSSWVLPVLIAGTVASFGLSVYGSYHARTATFFLLPMRAWELAAGSLLAFAAPIGSFRLRCGMAWTGMAAILLPFFLYVPGMRFPGLSALPPVAGAALLIWSGLRQSESCRKTTPQRLLGTRPLVWVGLLSYSLYLWHWPLFAFTNYISLTPASWLLRSALVGLSFLMAWLSLRFIERPFRSPGLVTTRKQVFGLSSCAIGVLLALSLFLWRTDGLPDRFPKGSLQVLNGETEFIYSESHRLEDIPMNLTHLGSKESPPHIFVWGDSHAAAILPAIDAVCDQLGLQAVSATASATPPVLEYYRDTTRKGLGVDAPEYNAAVLNHIKSLDRSQGVTHVILAARWSRYLKSQSLGLGFREALVRTTKALSDLGCEVIILQEAPFFPEDCAKSLALSKRWGWDVEDPAVTPIEYGQFVAEQAALFAELKTAGYKVTVVNPYLSMHAINGGVLPYDSIGALYFDDDHLNTRGSLMLANALRSVIQEGQAIKEPVH